METGCVQWIAYSEPNYRLFCTLSQMVFPESRKNGSLTELQANSGQKGCKVSGKRAV